MTTVTLKNINKTYEKNTIIENLSLDIHSGEFIVLVGPSGCGKSTLLRIIAGLESLNSGSIIIGDQDVTDLPAGQRSLSMVFQSYALYPHMTVRENLAFGLNNVKTPKDEITRRITQAAKMLQLEELLDRLPQNLSGGQRQRVAIGRSTVQQPKIFLFDEPLSNLDAALRVEMRQEISQLHGNLHNTMIYVTHDQVEAMTLADRIVVLYKGKIEQVGTPLELYNRPENLFVAEFIGTPKINILPATFQRNALHIANDVILPMANPPATLQQGDKVFIGIRPEHLRLGEAADYQFDASAKFTELQGDSTLVYLDLAGQSVCLKSFQQLNFTSGTALTLGVDEKHLHLFDALGKRLAH
ncbi:ABC transporter ATP-binding protein [Buttiauxella ferragutiae]|uniref:ABC transporter ATP-binding protein n=1 Tax=Buttiauxella ferragutiae TaxID=82989 RepID=UPI001F5337BF|nr:sn-glycerol-3-phosphate ABC transporter ATP-binding protein UgpC [Buttiauxella ferragutiae]UNK61901.1 sn-glycerol-3-phosphate ABC transporter ATP-binding protein UgpC [Buttiauxella ferragutiae]